MKSYELGNTTSEDFSFGLIPTEDFFNAHRIDAETAFNDQYNRHTIIAEDPLFEGMEDFRDAAQAGIVSERTLAIQALQDKNVVYDELFLAYHDAEHAEKEARRQILITAVAARAIELSPDAGANIIKLATTMRGEIQDEKTVTKVISDFAMLSKIYEAASAAWSLPEQLTTTVAQTETSVEVTNIVEPEPEPEVDTLPEVLPEPEVITVPQEQIEVKPETAQPSRAKKSRNKSEKTPEKISTLSGRSLKLYQALTQTLGRSFSNTELGEIVYGDDPKYLSRDENFKKNETTIRASTALNPKKITNTLKNAFEEDGYTLQYGKRQVIDKPGEDGKKVGPPIIVYRAITESSQKQAVPFGEVAYHETVYTDDVTQPTIRYIKMSKSQLRSDRDRTRLDEEPKLSRSNRRRICDANISSGGEE